MAELRKVPGPSSPLTGTSGKVVAVVVVGILLAVIKPWGSSPAVVPAAVASPSPTPPTSTATPVPDGAFDWGAFEGFQPHPAWEIWPAGREISFGFAMKIVSDDGAVMPAPLPSGDVSGRPGASTGPTPTPTPEPSPDPDPPTWSQTIAISPASTLTVVAINTPIGYAIPDATLTRLDLDGRRVAVPILWLPSPWPDHFLVIGIDDGSGESALPAWPAGSYALDLRIDPGGWQRTIMIDVQERFHDAGPSPSPVG